MVKMETFIPVATSFNHVLGTLILSNEVHQHVYETVGLQLHRFQKINMEGLIIINIVY